MAVDALSLPNDRSATRPAGLEWPAWVAVAAGIALFAVRPYSSLDPYTAPVALAAIYGALLIVSIGPADGGDRQMRVSPVVATAMGAAAIAAVRLLSHPVTLPDSRAIAIALGLAAAVAEEAYFRRLVYGRLQRFGAIAAIVGAAVVFSLMHYPAYGLPALPLDFGAGLLFGWQRWATGSWLAPAATHGLANLLSSI